MLQYYLAYVNEAADEIQQLTLGQGDETCSAIWLAERKQRIITSSVVGDIAKCRTTTKVQNLMKKMLYSTFRGNKATEWGFQQEEPTEKEYIAKQRVGVSKSGLVITNQHP